jgi:hypothetical protein
MTHNKLLGAINKDTGKYTPPKIININVPSAKEI